MRFSLEIGPTFTHLCDASAVAPLGGNQFFAASDEPTLDGNNQLRIYELDSRAPIAKLNLNKFLRGDGAMYDPDHTETDIESATRAGDTIFWISSHGRNSRGKFRPDRHRFFAISLQNGVWRPLGTPYTNLLADFKAIIPEIKGGENDELAPEKGGISIEGLCRGQGSDLLICFRSPLINDGALVVPLLNPMEVIAGKAARLGTPFSLDLDGRGIRDWHKLSANIWLILAGSSRTKGTFALYQWNGDPETAPTLMGEVDEVAANLGLDNFHPESILHLQDNTLWLVSDDGDLTIDEEHNSELPAPQRTFRSAQLILES